MLSKLVSIDNFFKNPQKIVDMAQTLDYERSEVHPGKRSINLFTSHNPQHVEFAKYFAKRIADEVFFGINKFMIDIRFHKNDIYDNDKANVGWIHNDPVSFAGIVYLNKEISDFNLGTSTFLKNKKERKALKKSKGVYKADTIRLQHLQTFCMPPQLLNILLQLTL